MSSKGKGLAAAREIVEYFASSIDAHFQDFLDKGSKEDPLGTAIAAAQAAQVAQALTLYFTKIANACIGTETELKAVQQACRLSIKRTYAMMDRVLGDNRTGGQPGDDVVEAVGAITGMTEEEVRKLVDDAMKSKPSDRS